MNEKEAMDPTASPATDLRLACQQAHESLQKSDQRFRALIEHSHDAITLIAADGTVLYDSPSVARVLGHASTERLGRKVFEFAHPDERDSMALGFAEFVGQPGSTMEYRGRFLHKDGQPRWIEGVRSNLLREPTVQAIVVNYRDITERKRAEEALRRSEKLQAEAEKFAAAGRMAALVAHEINNPLAGIKNSFRLIRDAVPKDHPDRDMVERIEREIDRIAQIVRQMYQIYSPRVGTPRDIPVGETVRDVLALLEPLCREHEVTVELGTILPELTVRACAGSLQQVLYNLAANAIQASPRAAVIHVAAELADEDYVRISVRDQGRGIPAEVRDRIFEPWVSADAGGLPKQGLGLGLAVVKSIVDSLGGRIEFQSTPGEGTCFCVYLPSKRP